MDKFIKEYLHSTEATALVGKFGFFADDEYTMVEIVNEGRLSSWDKLTSAGNQEYPFNPLHINKYFKLFYYDPYYKLKSDVEYDGKVLEVNLDGVWTEVTDLESFFTCYPNPYPPEQYRTELNRRIVTHRELTKWLATGHGQVRSCSGDKQNMYVVSFGYSEDLDDRSVEGVLVRSWDDVAWHLPTASYLGLDN